MKTRQEAKSSIPSGRSTTATRNPARRKAKSLEEKGTTASVATARQDNLSGQPIHLEFTHPSARSVCIAGSFNDWTSREMIRLGGDKWVIDLNLPSGSYEYRLIVDGHWMPDPNATNTVPNPFGERNSLLQVPEHSKS